MAIDNLPSIFITDGKCTCFQCGEKIQPNSLVIQYLNDVWANFRHTTREAHFECFVRMRIKPDIKQKVIQQIMEAE